ncbi:MAG: response regulator [Spirochaetes bacterium]|nr:response regulator [Spirochaetota bacterium]HPA73017.1 response regulator [Spirochaetota bacterium]
MKKKVLIVEDNENNRYLETVLMEHAGFTVVQAVNGREGIAAALREKPDIILMDIQMPEMDGYETTTQILADESLRGIPVVGVSSYALSGDREKALAMGFAGYIEKPINPDTFADEVRRHLRRGGDSA